MADENLPTGTGSEPTTSQPPERKETAVQDVEATARNAAQDAKEVVEAPVTLFEKVEHAFEDLRDFLVKHLGDHHGVHSTVDDAKRAISSHVPVESAIPAPQVANGPGAAQSAASTVGATSPSNESAKGS